MGLKDAFNSVTDSVTEKVKDYIPDSEARQKIATHALNLVNSPLGKEALKVIPGGGLAHETYKWSQSGKNDDKTKGKQTGNQKVEADHADLKYEKEVLHGPAGRSGSGSGSPKALHPTSVMAEKPEDVLRVTEKVKRHSPDVATHVCSACRSSYDVGPAAVFKIDIIVRVQGSEKLKDYIPDSEARQKIGTHALNLVNSPLGKEALKVIPGAGLAHETYKWSQSVQNDDKTKDKETGNHKVEADHADLKCEEALHGRARRSGSGSGSGSVSPKALHPTSVMAEKPKDVLRARL